MFRGLTRREHSIFMALLVILLGGVAYNATRRQPQMEVLPLRPLDGPSAAASSFGQPGDVLLVDINTATADAMAIALPGIGPVRAEAIVRHREAHGPFRSIRELERVSGIGPKTMDSLAPLITVGDVEPAVAAQPGLAPPGQPYAAAPMAAAPPPDPSAVVNINTATEAELQTLSGIGEVRARDIIVNRMQYGPFRSVDDLKRVRGIGDATVANNRHRLTVN